MIRPATIHDVPRIQAIINSHAELGKMLFKSLAQLFEDLRDFAVHEEDDGQIVGCVALGGEAQEAEPATTGVEGVVAQQGGRPS